MDIASPFSILDRMKPANPAQRAGEILAAGVAAASRQQVDRLEQAAMARMPLPAAARRAGFGEIVDQPPRAAGRKSPRDTARVAERSALPATATPFDRQAPAAPRPAPAADPRPAPDRSDAPAWYEGGTAEAVIAAGFDGLDLLDRGHAARLASGLARAAYAALGRLG